MSEKPTMSSGTKELLKKVRMIVPPMLDKFHKGKSPVNVDTSNIFINIRLYMYIGLMLLVQANWAG